MPTICLAMIVKNESHVIERCLDSVRPVIDALAICDTGSTDGTQDKIRAWAKRHNLPCVIADRPWRDFGTNRTEALALAREHPGFRADYVLMIDADDALELDPAANIDAAKAALRHTIYNVEISDTTTSYLRPALTSNNVAFVYRDVIHEWLDDAAAADKTRGRVHAFAIRRNYDGARTKDGMVAKLTRDCKLLLDAATAEPTNSRYAFYLANTYRDLEQFEDAITWYRKRLTMGGWAEELFMSSYRIAVCLGSMGRTAEAAVQFLDAANGYPHRAEPLHALALMEQRAERHRTAAIFARAGLEIPFPDGGLFVEREIYDWRLKDILAVSLYWMGDKAAALKINEEILPRVPDEQRPRIQSNIRWCLGQGP